MERGPELLRHGLGQVTRVSGASSLSPADAAELANTIQHHLINETRLGIPAIVHEEICAGLMARDSTIFPQAIGLASTWQPELAAALADAVRFRCGRWAPTRGSRRCSTSAVIRGGDAPRRRSARIPTSSPGWVSGSSVACRATTSPTG